MITEKELLDYFVSVERKVCDGELVEHFGTGIARQLERMVQKSQLKRVEDEGCEECWKAVIKRNLEQECDIVLQFLEKEKNTKQHVVEEKLSEILDIPFERFRLIRAKLTSKGFITTKNISGGRHIYLLTDTGRLFINESSFESEAQNAKEARKFAGDNYTINNSTVGAIGSNATASNNTFQQLNYSVPDDLDYLRLSEQLELLRIELVRNAKGSDEFKAIAEVAEAEAASKEKDGSKVIRHLKTAGKWVFDNATKIGVDIVTELLKQKM